MTRKQYRALHIIGTLLICFVNLFVLFVPELATSLRIVQGITWLVGLFLISIGWRGQQRYKQ